MLKRSFNLSREVYDENLLQQGILAFEENYDIVLKDNELIISGQKEEEIEEVFNEFMNYVLALYNECS